MLKRAQFYNTCLGIHFCEIPVYSGVARAFPGGRVAHPESQNEEETEKSLRKNKKKRKKFGEKMRKVGLLPIRDCEAGYGPVRLWCEFWKETHKILIKGVLWLQKKSSFRGFRGKCVHECLQYDT